VNPYHDRLANLPVERPSPDVQRKAIFALAGFAERKAGAGSLDGDSAEAVCGTHSVPRFDWLGRTPPKRTNRGLGIRNPEEAMNSGDVLTLQTPLLDDSK
jgi:hypothetical protein